MSRFTPPAPYDAEMVRRAFRTADPDGEAALNWLLYSGGALLASAVLLVITTPAALGVVLAMIPWLALAVAGWWWLRPALHGEASAGRERDLYFDRARDAAVELLLDDTTLPGDRRLAAAYLSGDVEEAKRRSAAQQLLDSTER